jgi:hypothetical protein
MDSHLGGNDGFLRDYQGIGVQELFAHFDSSNMFSRRSAWSLGFIAVALIAAALILSVSPYILRVSTPAEARDLAAIPVAPGDRLEVKYTHSMFEVPQVETFSIGSDLLFHLEKVSFGSQAAALYYDPDPPQRPTVQDSLWVLAANGTNYPVLRYRVSPGTGHVLMVKDRRVDLSGRATAPGMLVEVKVEERSRIMGAFAGLWNN